MSCNCNYNCQTIKDFLKCLWIENISCKSKVCEFNRILRKFYLDVYDVDFNRVTEPFIWNWSFEIITNSPIYKLIWIFWKEECGSCWCTDCLLDVPSCEWACRCNNKLKQVMHSVWDKWELKVWEYTLWYKCVQVNIPDCLSNWYITYYKWPDVYNSLDEKLCMPDELLVALEHLVLHEYAIKDKMFEFATYYAQMYNQILKKLKDKELTVPFSVWKWADLYKNTMQTIRK